MDTPILGLAKNFKLGEVVQITTHDGDIYFGHVDGFGLNEVTNEIVVIVKLPKDNITQQYKYKSVHPSLLQLVGLD